MELRLEGQVLRLAQIGPDFLILKAPMDVLLFGQTLDIDRWT